MGSQYSKKMRAPRSKTAVFVQHEAPPICSISFICPGKITCTREARPELITQSPETQLNSLPWSRSMPQGDSMSLLSPTPDSLRKCQSTNAVSPPSRLTGATMTPRSTLTIGRDVDIWDQKMRTSEAGESSSSTWTNDLGKFSMPRDEDGCSSQFVRESEEGFLESHQVHTEFACNGEGLAKYQLQQTMEEVNKAKQEAYEESLRRQKAEMAAFEVHLKAKTTEKSYIEEKRQRIEFEEALRMTTIEVQSLKSRRDEVLEELHKANDRRLMFEVQISDSKQTVKELEEKLQSAQDLTVNLQREREELQRECDEAIMEAETTRKAATSSSQCAHNFSEFTYIEIMEATNNFSDSLKIGEGGYGSVYKGFLHHTPVAIKMLRLNSSQGCDEFYQEVNVLSKVRHPNLVTLIGACPEAWALVYEYLPNGSLEDRLQRCDGTPSLTWQARTRIAAEVCATLIFLHSNRPNMVIHGDLKPGNILLDANLISKLSDFGICRLLHNPSSSNPPTSTLCHHTDPKGTFTYMDPEFLSTGELTHRSDVYSFGVILLQLLTARPALAIQKVVQDALDNGTLNTVLDTSAGKWPFVQAKQLAHIGLRCCELNRKRRPDLASDVWRLLEPMKVSAGAPSSFRLAVDEHGYIPSYFMCPIFQEIMKDPHVAADGYTYEAEALKGWLESGQDTSPMTNVKLSHHQLIPNHALRSAIQEWMQQQRRLC
ncbi:U-box domain-containing protein 33 [Acorus calamus]|uniref:RING-type E3 ubiquitin transferase n=1 Tax=Acorus calamus TaxID=4465 RepID=A0AAV9E6L5_ACOCL|nr:U-box domain-containing protein 33 [Acorus calamus]